MAMPEATMNEDDRFIFWQHQVGLAGQGFIVQFVPEALSMQKLPHQHFRFGVLALYLAHVITAGGLIVHICHGVNVRSCCEIPGSGQ